MAFLDFTGLGYFLNKIKTIFISKTEKGAASGVASLDSTGKIPSAQLPASIKDVIEAPDFESLPSSGAAGKIYITLDDNKVYHWDGSAYVSVSNTDVLVGATMISAGVAGLAPAPAAGDNTKVLMGDGTWKAVPGARVITTTGTVENVSGAYTGTFQNPDVSGDMVAIRIELGTPSVFHDRIYVTCNTGYITVSCQSVVGTSSISISTIKSAGNTGTMTSAEFDLLNEAKADKVAGAINGHFAAIDANGNLIDSGHQHSDYITQAPDVSGKLNVSGMLYVEDGDTARNNINAGSYVYWREAYYVATTSISYGDTLGMNNLMPHPREGVLNQLKTNISSKYTKPASGIPASDFAEDALDSFYHSYWNTTTTVSVPFSANGKTYLIWSSASTPGSSGGIMDSADGCLIIASNGRYAIIHKGSNITVSVQSTTLTVTNSAAVPMAVIEL